jgi:thiol-disulfide isomerase/thioredoxin
MKKNLLFIAALVSIALYLITSFSNRPDAESNPNKGDFDYNFTLKDIRGTVIDFNQYRNKVVFINLWATWCGPCRSEMPGINNLYQKTGTDDIAFVMLSVDRPGDVSKVKAYVERNAYTFPVFIPDQSLPEQLNVRAIPATFIIDKQGKIHKSQMGAANYDTPDYIKLLNNLAKGN